MTNEKTVNALASALNLSNAKVVNVNAPSEVVINRGRADGLREGQMVLIYAVGKEIVDPDTNESLGRLEVVRGKGKVVHLQQRMATVENVDRSKPGPFGMFGTNTEEVAASFRNAAIGDLVRILA